MKMGFAIWFTGIPSSGKTTLAKGVADKLRKLGNKLIVLESDEIRKLITPEPRYTEDERDIFYRSLATIATLFVREGYIVLIDATAHKRIYREYARKLIDKFIEVYVYCPIDVCIERDAKGLYKKAFKGEIKTLPGLQTEYEEPINPDIKVDTNRLNIDESVEYIYKKIIEKLKID